MISVKNLEKAFGDNKVLNGINQEIEKGEKVVIVGPSGSGKSTFLRCLNLLEVPTGGEIWFEGEKINDPKCDINRLRRKMGMVFQHFNLFPHLTVKKNITLAPVHLKLMGQKEADDLAMSLLQRVGLADKADAYPNQLSGGQKQRIAIVRALAMKPDVMLFDEPTLRSGPGDGRRGAGSYEAAGRRGHDHGGGDPRNGLCPGGCHTGAVYGPGQGAGGSAPGGVLQQSEESPFAGFPLQSIVS